MEKGEKLNWEALEYEEKEKHVDWFWALGVVIVAGSIASVIFGNYFFAAFLIIGGLLMGYFSIKKPEMFFYELNDSGLKIKTRLYPYEDIKSFWISAEEKPTLFIESKRIIMPMISVPIELSFAEKIQNAMLAKNIPEKEMKPHVSEKIMERIGF